VRRLQNYVRKYGPEFGPKLYHALQSQAAHAGVSARLRRKIDVLTGKAPTPTPREGRSETTLPLFPEPGHQREMGMETSPEPEPVAVGA
jgi:hypothetical protein